MGPVPPQSDALLWSVQCLALVFLSGLYLVAMKRWVAGGPAGWGIGATLLILPAILWISVAAHIAILAALPLAALGFFVFQYRSGVLRQPNLLHFSAWTILSVYLFLALVALAYAR